MDPDLFGFPHFTTGISGQLLQKVTLGGAMIALPIFLQMTLEYDAMKTGLTLAPLSLSMFAVALLAGRSRAGFAQQHGARRVRPVHRGLAAIVPVVPRADSGWALFVPLLITGCGLGLLVSQLNNYTLSPVQEERVSEAAGVNSAAGSFGLSFGLAMAGGIMLAVLSLSFTNLTEQSDVIPPAQQQQIADTLEDDAEVMSNTQLERLLAGEPEDVPAEILEASTARRGTAPCRSRCSCPILAGMLGVLDALRMRRLPDPVPANIRA